MRIQCFGALLLLTGWVVAAHGQEPAQTSATHGAPVQLYIYAPTQLTPGEEREKRDREKQVRQFDPLDPGDQDTQDQTKTDNRGTPREASGAAPAVNSIGAAERDNAARQGGPRVVPDYGSDLPVQEYSGPAVLSRSFSINRPIIPQQVRWTEMVGATSIYETGLPVQSSGGTIVSGSSPGAQINWGFTGRHYFRRDQVAFSYLGNESYYSDASSLNGSNNSLSVDYSHVLSRRFTLNLFGNGSIFSANYILENQVSPETTVASINFGTSPNVDILNNGAKEFSARADVVWQKTSRLSFNFGTAYFGTARNDPNLIGVTGQQLSADTVYRVTRNTTAGAYYSFSHYLYPHGVGNTSINTFGLIYSYAFNRSTQLRVRAGVSVSESLGLRAIALNPELAVLLGQATSVIDLYSNSRTPDLSAQIIKDFRRGRTASVAYARGISPGNGVSLSSRQESVSAAVNTTFLRTFAFSAGVGRDTLASFAQTLGNYKSNYARASISKAYRSGIALNAGVDYRHFVFSDVSALLRNQVRITSGVSWNSRGDRLWPF